MRRIMVTGSNGFVGRQLVSRLLQQGYEINATSRSVCHDALDCERLNRYVIGRIDGSTNWIQALKGCDTVVHLAGDMSANQWSLNEVNNRGTQQLVRQSVEAGVISMIYVSSLAVLDQSISPITDDTDTSPSTLYGESKSLGEDHIMNFREFGGTSVILRPPLIYGAGAAGKWKYLSKLALSPIPLPIKTLGKRRTLISLDNLTSAIERIIYLGRSASSGTFVIGDNEAVTLAEIVAIMRAVRQRPARVFCAPDQLFKIPFKLLGKQITFDRLFGELEIDASNFRKTFDWSPPETAALAIARSVT